MIKFGKTLGIPYLLCYNHTIDLAVKDKLFANEKSTEVTKEKISTVEKSSDLTNEDCDHESEYDDSENEVDESENDDDTFIPCSNYRNEEFERFEIDKNYKETLERMKKIVKMFRYSSFKSGILKAIMEKDGETFLKFVADVSTRWSSLLMCAIRFLELLPYTLKALKHKEIIKNKAKWTDLDTYVLKVIISLRNL